MFVKQRQDAQGLLTDDLLSSDPWFNPYRVPASDRAHAVVRDVAQQVQRFEQFVGRKRRRKESDQRTYDAIVTALVADLTHHFLSGSPGSGLVVPRSKEVLDTPSRYRPPALTGTFRDILDRMAAPEMAFLEQCVGSQSGRKATTVKAGRRLITRIKEHRLTFEDLDVSDVEEVIVLKDKADDPDNRADRKEYDDTPTTTRYRDEVRTINDWIKRADISFDRRSAAAGVTDTDILHIIEHADPKSRAMRRYFSRGSFESGGRLFGAFWQQLPKEVRIRGIKIESAPVVSLDYGQMNPLLAYSMTGHEPPAGDAYTLPGMEEYREGVKTIFNAMLFTTKPLSQFPRGTRSEFPRKTRIKDVTTALLDKHRGLEHVFHTGAGHRMMFIESEIMMRVLLHLRSLNILGLPVFDAIVVKASDEDTVKTVMYDQFKTATGLPVAVRREGS